MRMPVSIGSVSSRLAEGATCATAAASRPPPTAPIFGGISGSAGNSSTGMVCSPNSALPQVRIASPPSVTISTGWSGRLLVISASTRPGISVRPGSATWASTVARADTS